MQVEKARPQVIDEILTQLTKSYGLDMEREGIHATDCIYCLRKAFWNKTDPLPATPQETLYYLFGLGLQDVLISTVPHEVRKVDGIWMSSDYFKDGILLELKTTMIGEKRLDAYDFPEGWIKQIKAYCYGYKVNSAVLMVVTLIKREIFSYILSFTDEELEENWKWLSGRANQLDWGLQNNTIPREKGFDFECDNCRYRLRCQLLEKEDGDGDI